MSTQTDEPSIAHLIGWRYREDPERPWRPGSTVRWFKTTKPWREEVGRTDRPPVVTVDDMLAWLRGRGYQFYAKTRAITDPGIYVGVSQPGGGPTCNEQTPYPTLHAALESAVRAVSGLAETPESNPT